MRHGLCEVDPQRSVSVLTDTILRLNDTISGFVKAAEFLDTNGEITTMARSGRAMAGR